MKKIISFFFIVLFSSFLFSEIKVLSPVPGKWANRQMLVIESDDGADYFYSLNGDDPEISGFAYDGPVLIDMTGDITLKITRNFEEKIEVSFSVLPAFPEEDEQRAFVYSFFDTGIFNYFSGAEINIPSSMRYSFEKKAENYNPGKKLSYSEKCSLSRFLPCTVTDGNLFWRFIIRANPKATGSFSRRDLPFSVKDWNTIVFDDKNLLFRIDSEYWTIPSSPRTLDRSVSHVVYWQSMDFKPDNPVEFFELPPVPSLRKETNENGSVSFFLDGDDSYSMTISEKDSFFYELYTELCADTFTGDYLSDSFRIAVYADSVYQGELKADYEIDKRLPSFPVFTSSNFGFHARGTVSLNISTSKSADLYVALSDPFELDNSEYEQGNPLFASVNPSVFKKMENNVDLILQSNSDKPVYYKVRAYSVSGTHISDISEYEVILDSYSFYFDSDADALAADGSKDHPFTEFGQGLELMRKSRSVNIFIKGNIKVPKGKNQIDFNCDIQGLDGASMEFQEGASFVVKNSTLQVTDCRITSNSVPSKATNTLIKLENSVLSIKNSDIYYAGGRNATFADCQNSVLMISGSAITVTSQVYASFLSASKSRLSLKDNRIAVVADTAVCLSLRESKINSEKNSFRVTGTIGRIAEFFGTEGSVNNCVLSADLKRGSDAVQPFFIDDNSKITEVSNRVQGF